MRLSSSPRPWLLAGSDGAAMPSPCRWRWSFRRFGWLRAIVSPPGPWQRDRGVPRAAARRRDFLRYIGLGRDPAMGRSLPRLRRGPRGALEFQPGAMDGVPLSHRRRADGDPALRHRRMGASGHRRGRPLPRLGVVGVHRGCCPPPRHDHARLANRGRRHCRSPDMVGRLLVGAARARRVAGHQCGAELCARGRTCPRPASDASRAREAGLR